MRFGVCTHDITKYLVINNTGYDYIEENFSELVKMTSTQFKKLQEELLHNTMKAEVFNCFFSGEFSLCDENLDFHKISEYCKFGFDRASQIGGEIAVIGSGKARSIPAEISREKAVLQLEKVFRICGDIAGDFGMSVVIEPLNQEETNIINTVEECILICDQIQHKRVGVQADFYHMFKTGETLNAIIDSGEKLKHVHIARPNADRRIPTVEDIEDFKPFASALKKNGYHSRISLEGNFDEDFETCLLKAKSVLRLFE